jgi:hypothetical protein
VSSRLVNFYVAHDWRMWITPTVLAVAHTDSANRVTSGRRVEIAQKRRQMSADRADVGAKILADLGCDISKSSPAYYAELLRQTARQNFSAGRRLKGARYSLWAVWHRPLSLRGWGILAAGLIGPRAMAHLRRRSAP